MQYTKEFRKDLYTQAEYARKINRNPQYITQLIKAGKVSTLTINGTTLIKAI